MVGEFAAVGSGDGEFVMKQEDKKIISEQVNTLMGKKLSKIGRAAAMAWLTFLSNDEKEYALHLQCGFRICANGETIIANLDMFEPTKSLEESPSFDWETFNWDVQGFNRYDEWTTQYNKDKEKQTIVEVIEVNTFGDLTIKFTNGIIIEVFANAATGECWRFFERKSDHHLVVSAQGIEK